MRTENLTAPATGRDKKALSEYQAKELLAAYGIPVTREILARTPEEAARAASTIGFPVAVKGCSPELMHKSEGGWIVLGLRTPDEVAAAAEGLLARKEVPLDGVLVQEMVRGSRELVAGLIRDPQFGPCVMLGLGGVMTEVFRDTAFRMAPLDEVEARDMVRDLKCRDMLAAFRGQRPADPDVLAGILTALGRLGLEREDVAEVDVNPLIITPDGEIKAVDALVVLEA